MKRVKKKEEIIVLNLGQKYIEAIPLKDGINVQLVPCGWTDMEKLGLQVSIQQSVGTVNYFISPYIGAIEAEA